MPIRIPNAFGYPAEIQYAVGHLDEEILRALFWDEHGNWHGAASLSLLHKRPDDVDVYDRTTLGESVAALVVCQSAERMSAAERQILQEAHEIAFGPSNELVVHSLCKQWLLWDRDGAGYEHGRQLIRTQLGHEVVEHLRSKRIQHLTEIDAWLDEHGAELRWSRDVLDGNVEAYDLHDLSGDQLEAAIVLRHENDWRLFVPARIR